MQKEDEAENTSRTKLFGHPFYDKEKTGLCTRCKKVWKREEQIIYESKNKNRKYGICPECKIKQPLRMTPRTRDSWLRRYPVKRIE